MMRNCPWKSFFWLALLSGVVLAFAFPPFHVPDEPSHFFRSYQISTGKILAEKRHLTTGGTLPKSLGRVALAFTEGVIFHADKKIPLERICREASIELAVNETEFTAFSNTAIYSPLPYLPQAAAIGLGAWLKLPPVLLLYAGRMSNLLCAIAIITLAIRITPLYKWVFFLTALSPMNVHLMASLSADALTNAVAMILTAQIFKYSFDDSFRLKHIDLVILMILSIILALCKPGYSLLTVLYFLIPRCRIGPTHVYLLWGLSICGLALGCSIIWSHLVNDLFNAPYEIGGIMPSQQLHMILLHPWAFLVKCYENIRHYWLFYGSSFIGILGWLDLRLPQFFYLIHGSVMLITIMFSGNPDISVNPQRRILLLSVAVLNIITIITSCYLMWTPVWQEEISPAQGRYFLPFAVPGFLVFYSRNRIVLHGKELLALFLPSYVLISLFLVVANVISRYYGDWRVFSHLACMLF